MYKNASFNRGVVQAGHLYRTSNRSVNKHIVECFGELIVYLYMIIWHRCDTGLQ